MTESDYFIFKELHSFSARSPFFNHLMYTVSGMDFLASGVVVAFFWYYWFRKSDNQDGTRYKVITALISSLIAIILARIMTRVLPFTLRPALNPGLNNLFPYHEAANNLNSSNSMPSDHAVLYLAMATGIFLISKRAGILSFLYLFFIGLFPRVYLGLHFPVDIYVGGLIGIVTTLIYSHLKISHLINHKVLKFSMAFPGVFYALFFLMSSQMATMFGTSRHVMQFLATTLKQFI